MSDTAVKPVGWSSTRAPCNAAFAGSVTRPLTVPFPSCAWAAKEAFPAEVESAEKERLIRPAIKNNTRKRCGNRMTSVSQSSGAAAELTSEREFSLGRRQKSDV